MFRIHVRTTGEKKRVEFVQSRLFFGTGSLETESHRRSQRRRHLLRVVRQSPRKHEEDRAVREEAGMCSNPSTLVWDILGCGICKKSRIECDT